MKSIRKTPPPDFIRDFLCYDGESGEFMWIKAPSGVARLGSICETINGSGYVTIKFKGRQYRAHRLAWWYVHGEWPAVHVDHINGVKIDNRIANLRLATDSQNGFNSAAYSTNKTGFRGVSERSGRFVAVIYSERKQIHLGTFATPEAAAAAYRAASARIAGEFEHPSVSEMRKAGRG